jgi:anti-anti-sigma factor
MSPIIENCRLPAGLHARRTLRHGGAQSALRTTAEHTGSAVIVSAGGEVDASNAAAWELLLSKTAATAITPGPLVVNVHDLDFMGCCAVAVLARQAARCRRRAISVCLVSQQPIVARTVAACGLRRVLPIYPSIEAALSQTSSGPFAGRTPLG